MHCIALTCTCRSHPAAAAAVPAAPPAVVCPAGKVVEKAGEMFEETGAVGKQFTPHGAAGKPRELTMHAQHVVNSHVASPLSANHHRLSMYGSEHAVGSLHCCQMQLLAATLSVFVYASTFAPAW